MNEFNEAEFLEICKRFNAAPDTKEIAIREVTESFFNKIKKNVASDRRGEVVFCVLRPGGKIIAVTCAEYPEGIYRIPTGGIGHQEDIVEAVFRETKEELGLETDVLTFAGAMQIRFEYKEETVMFYSYVFILKETGGRLLADASDDEISAVREVDLSGLQAIADALRDIPGQWNSWGKFRYVSTSAVLEYLKGNPWVFDRVNGHLPG